jgi:peptidylprolyl isomerase
LRRALVVLLLSSVLVGAATALPALATTTSGTALPSVHGAYGTTPTVSFPTTTAPKSLISKVLSTGSGPVVEKDDVVAVNYLGQIWRGKVFDSSFSRKTLFGFAIDDNQVIAGWNTGLTGVHVGSRVLLVIPPVDGYGSAGSTGAGITGTDTLVFVVDVVGLYAHNAKGDVHATALRSSVNGIEIHGPLGSPPTLQIPKSAKAPTRLSASVVAKGHGPLVKAGLVIIQYVAYDWTDQVVASTWKLGEPEADPIGDPSSPSPYDSLIGIPVGSRVLLEIPKTSSTPAYAVAIDIVGQPVDPQK